MKKGNTLVDTLYWLCNISFYLLVLLFGVALVFQIFTKDGQIGNFSAGNHHSVGYPMPVSFNIQPQRPMNNNMLFKLKSEGTNIMGQKSSSGTSEYVKPITSKDSLSYKTIVSIRNHDMKDYYELNSSTFRSDGYVTVKPKTTINKIIILFRTHVNFILTIIIFFFLKNAFKSLRINLEFSQKLYKIIKTIGVLLIFQVLVVSISNFILGKVLPHVSIEPLDHQLRYVTIYMNPRLDFDFTLLLIGLSLIILSTLLKKGNRIQQENDLTI